MNHVEPVTAGALLPGDVLTANNIVSHSRACLVTGSVAIGDRVQIHVIEGSVFDSTSDWKKKTLTFDAGQRVGRLRKA